MSLPRETIEQLLSGYMDDALSDEERGQIEALLRTDDRLAAELKQLRRQRESLQFIARADSTLRLEHGFADRVLDAAVQRARAEGLSEDHHVVRLTEQPSTSTRFRSQRSLAPMLSTAAVVGALAASVMVALAFWQLNQPSETASHSLADVESVPQTSPLESRDRDSSVAQNDTVDAIASERNSDDVQPGSFIEMTTADRVPQQQNEKTAIAADVNEVSKDKLASRDTKATAENSQAATKRSANTIASSPQRMVGAVMVLDVSQTAAGRMSRAVRRAMNAADIKIQNEKLIADEIVGVLGNSSRQDDQSLEGASVYYLEGTAKQLDRFILSLCGDEQGIETVKFGLASELPILNLLQKLQRPIDPKTVHHSASWSIQGKSSEASRLLTNALVDRTMAPLASNMAELGVIPGANQDGPDVMSELFVVVR